MRVSADLRAAANTLAARKRLLESRSNRVMRALWQTRVMPHYLALAKHGRKDANAATIDIQEAEAIVDRDAKAIVKTWFDPMAAQCKEHSRRWIKASALTWKDHSYLVQDAIEVRKADSLALIRKANRLYAGAVEQVFAQPDIFGLRVEEIKKQLLDTGELWESRAALIARDQTLKLYAGISEAGHRENGIDSYIWSTSRDERVRPEHRALEGRKFRYDTPPEPGNPGEDYCCRCAAIPDLSD